MAVRIRRLSKPKVGIWKSNFWTSYRSDLEQEISDIFDEQEDRGWTDEQLSRESGVSPGTIWALYHGHTRVPSSGTLYRLKKALGLTKRKPR